MDYNLIVIGGGPAGYTAAIKAAQLGLKVVLIEKSYLGGTCLNRGCIPTKALLHSSGMYYDMLTAEKYGVVADNLKFDYDKAYQHKDNVVEKLVKGIEQLIKANKITLILENGILIDSNNVLAGGEKYCADNIIIATGSVPSSVPIKGIEQAINSDDVLSRPITSETIAIIGGGVIGVEFATMLAQTGKEVYLFEALPRIIPMMSEAQAKGLTMSLKKLKIKVNADTFIDEIAKCDTGYELKYSTKGKAKIITVGEVISCTGRKAYTKGLNLEEVGIELDKGNIVVDSRFRTSVPNIYAVGDVIGGIQLAHMAAAEAIVAVENICGKKPSINLDYVPSCIYTTPEIASIGITQEQCENRQIEVGKFLMGASGKALINGVSSGYAKVIIDVQTDKIIGAELFMDRATDLVSELSIAIVNGMTREEFASVIHPHPTLSESIYESIEDSLGKAIHLLPKI